MRVGIGQCGISIGGYVTEGGRENAADHGVVLRCVCVCMCVQLTSLGINQNNITFTHVTMESDKYICVRETSPQNSVVIVDISMPLQPLRRPITADSALMNPVTRVLALKGAMPPARSRCTSCLTLACSPSVHCLALDTANAVMDSSLDLWRPLRVSFEKELLRCFGGRAGGWMDGWTDGRTSGPRFVVDLLV